MARRLEQFEGIQLKATRVGHQLDALYADIRSYLDSRPFLPEGEFSVSRRELTIRARLQAESDPMFGVRIGEIVHNLRSALDHIVYELVVLNTGAAPTTKKNQFPIFETEAGFNDRGVGSCLHDVGAPAVDVIKAEQPFYTGEGANSPLWRLHELSNTDKHRTLHLTGALLQSYSFNLPPFADGVVADVREVRLAGPLENESVLWRGILTGAEAPIAADKFDATFTVDLAFDPGTPGVGGLIVFPILKEIADRVAATLTRLAAAFP